MKGTRLLIATALATLLAAGVSAQEKAAEKPSAKSAMEQAQEEELRARIQRDDWLVTMEFRDAKVQDIVAEFRRQVRMSIVLDTTYLPEGFRVDEFVVKNVPFRSAFNAFLSKAQMVIDEETAELIRISFPPRVSFNFKGADVGAVLDVIGRVANVNIIFNPKTVSGPISLNLHDVPWMDALDSVVKTRNLTSVREKGIIRVIDPDELKKQMETQVFKLKYLLPPPLYSAKVVEGKFISGKPPQPVQQVDQLLKGFFLKPTLEAVLTRDIVKKQALGHLDYDPVTNAFVVTDVKPVLQRVEAILKILDVEPAQIIVDVKFISTTNEDLLNFGMNYFFTGTGEDGITIRSTPLDPRNDNLTSNAATALGGKVTRMPFGLGHEPISSSQFFLTEYDLISTFRAFKRDRYSRLIQEPTITAVDNEMATIFVGEEVRYAEQQITTNQFGGLEITLGEARGSPVKIGFQLFILPRIIKESNKVLLTVIPINETLSGTTSPLAGFERFELAGVGPGGVDVSIDLPRVASTTIFSKMLLESGKTAVLGGLVVERSTLEDRKVPLLGDLPIIGYLFKQIDDTIRREHLLIFITPRIVRLDSDSERIQAAFKQREEALRREYEDLRRRATEGGEPKKDEGGSGK